MPGKGHGARAGRGRRAAGAVLAVLLLCGAGAAAVVLTVPGAGTPAGPASAARPDPQLREATAAAPAQPGWAADPARAVPRRPPVAHRVDPAGPVGTLPPASTTTTTGAPAAPPTAATSTLPPTTTSLPVTTTTACAGALPAQLSTSGGASQLVTVEAAGYGTTWATLTAWSKSGSCWHVAYGPFSARLGWSGLVPARRKVEGDGGTPEGIYGFGPVMYGNADDPGVAYPFHRLVCGDWWDEDPRSPDYNLFVHWPCGSMPPFAQGSEGSGSEALWKETGPYPAFAVVAYNTARIPGRGSAIFLHYGLASATAGCVSIDLAPLDAVLDWLRPGEAPAIVIGTAADIRSY